jgi:hypothetical protein
MMLSPQAARMGCVSTKGHIRRSTRFLSIGRTRRHFEPSIPSRFRPSTETARAFSSGLSRFKSTMAAYDDGEDDNVDYRHKGHVAAAKARASVAVKSQDEDWMINLGRKGENEWLTGPRDEEWFTGVAPRNCPGTYDIHILYGIILVAEWHALSEIVACDSFFPSPLFSFRRGQRRKHPFPCVAQPQCGDA